MAGGSRGGWDRKSQKMTLIASTCKKVKFSRPSQGLARVWIQAGGVSPSRVAAPSSRPRSQREFDQPRTVTVTAA